MMRPYLLNHRPLSDLLAEQKQRADVQIHHLVPSLDRVILGRGSPRSARIVDENVYSPQFRNRLVREPLDIVILGIVGGDPVGLDAKTGKVLLGQLEIGGLARRQDDFRSLLTERFRDLQAKTARPAGNQRRLSAQIERLLYAAHALILV